MHYKEHMYMYAQQTNKVALEIIVSVRFHHVMPECGHGLCQHFSSGVDEFSEGEVVVQQCHCVHEGVGRCQTANVHGALGIYMYEQSCA